MKTYDFNEDGNIDKEKMKEFVFDSMTVKTEFRGLTMEEREARKRRNKK